jgi:hypothetical protein
MYNIDEIIEMQKEIEKIDLIDITDITAILIQEHKVIKDLLNYIKEISKGE